jgi:predicted metal-dependent phosphoesterase TrpH
MSDFADLHIHTNISDGTYTPFEAVAKAVQAEIKCIAITDHDAVEGIAPAIESGRAAGVEVIPGIELSCEANGKDIHILGYCFDHTSEKLLGQLKVMQDSRTLRMRNMILKLNDLGFKNISIDDLEAVSGNTSIGRMHLAVLMVNKGIVKNYYEAFDKYLSEGKPVYVDKFYQTPAEAIAMIRDAGGVAVLAHPMITLVDELIPSMVKSGLKGLEVHYHNTTKTMMKFYANLAKKYGLIETGGSDSHGKIREHTDIGTVRIPYGLVERLKEVAGGG